MNNHSINTENWFVHLGDNPNDDQIIDAILILLFQSQSKSSLFLNPPPYLTNERIKKIVRLMEFHNLAKKDGKTYGNDNIPLKIEPNGNIIFHKYGGWLKYLENLKSEKQKERISKILSNFGVIVAFFALFLNYLQFSDSKENEDSLKKINNYLLKQDSIINAQNQKLQKIDSIVNSHQNKLKRNLEIQP